MAMTYMSNTFHFTCSSQRSGPLARKNNHLELALPSYVKPFLGDVKNKIPVIVKDAPKAFKDAYMRLLDLFVDHVFLLVDQPLLPSQSNFAPVEEIGEAVQVLTIEGEIPDDFPEGVYIRNGSNPIFGGLKSAISVFGKTSSIWVEGEGMLHALYFIKDQSNNDSSNSTTHQRCSWKTIYNNRFVQTTTFQIEKERNKLCFLPAVEGDPSAVISSFLLNMLRFGMPNKIFSNTNIIEHAGKIYSVAENYVPQEVDIETLETLGDWDIDGAWTRPFTSHPKKAPGTGELVTIGVAAEQPYFEIGVISADGTKLNHKVDLRFNRSTLSHELGVTQRYNVILDFPLIVSLNRVVRGGPLIKYEKEGYARIGIMARYGDANSVNWFQVEVCSAFHIINCYEDDDDDDEIVVMACRAEESIIPGPDFGSNKVQWFSKGFKNLNSVNEDDEGKLFTRAYEWRLNMKTGEVKEANISGTQFSMDFPIVNSDYIGLKNKFAYTQVVDSTASSVAGIAKYSGLAKLHIQERKPEFSNSKEEKLESEDKVKIEYHMFPESTFCSGAAFVAKPAAGEEDDGWIITFIHHEDTDKSEVYIVDAKHFSREPVAKIALPSRVPYGFHGTFASKSEGPICK